MNRKVLSLLIVAVMALSVVPLVKPVTATTSPVMPNISQTAQEPKTLKELNPRAANYIDLLKLKLESSKESSVRLILAPKRGYEDLVLTQLKELGARIDPISKPEYDFIVVTLSVNKLDALKNIKGLFYVWEDKTVKLPKPKRPEELPIKAPIDTITQSGDSGSYDPFMWDMYAINAPQAREEYGVNGSGVYIGIVDTGADVAQPYLQITPDGKRKIVYWLDTTGEGDVYFENEFNSTQVSSGVLNATFSNITIDWGVYYFYMLREKELTTIANLNLTIYFDGNVTNGTYRFGFLPERYFDINFDHNYDEVYFVLYTPDGKVYFYPIPLQLNTTNANTLNAVYFTGRYNPITKEPIYAVNKTLLNLMMDIPDNMNYTFTVNLSRAYEVTPFAETGDYILLGPGYVDNTTYVTFELGEPGVMEVANGTVYNSIVLSYVDEYGATFGWDGGQHGTHVSGTAAGYGPEGTYFEGLEGVAPGAQLLEFKSLSSMGFGRTSWIIDGMILATLNGADVISMSLGGLYEGYNDGLESPENYYADLLTNLFGVTFAIAAGNDGPTTNTVGSPGDADLVITVGNYWSEKSWEFWYGAPNVADGPAMSSSRGPRLDGMVDPDVMAPGSFIFSSLPIWSVGSYGTWASDFWDGTSMATPHVSGAVALMISYAKAHNLTYNPFMIKRALELSAKPVEGATPIDQGAGLIQVDKAIEELIRLSNEKTTYIYAGTSFGPYTNPLGEKELPLFANILFNSYFAGFNFPYLYRGVYIRNERPSAVPIYIYGMEYGKKLVPVNGTYRISTSVPWLYVDRDTVEATLVKDNFTLAGISYINFYKTTGVAYVTIDYSKLTKPGTYVGYVYIDDPSTSYIDGVVPVVVTVPLNKDGESKASLSDVEAPGQAKHYYVDVPVGTQELKVTMSIPIDENGTFMGRARPYIVDPRGHVIAGTGPSYGLNFYYLGPGGPANYTWVIPNPAPGTWEITVYSSTFTSYFTGYPESHYNLDVELAGITASPSKVFADYDKPGIQSVSVEYRNELGTVNVTPFGYGLGILNRLEGYLETINQDDWQVVDFINATLDQKLYYFRMGITAPHDSSADLDLYVVYFANDDVLNSYAPLLYNPNTAYLLIVYAYYGLLPGVKVYLDQVGPTSYESFDRFMPEQGYYFAIVNGYDVPEENMTYVYYHQILADKGDITTSGGSFNFQTDTSKTVTYNLNVTGYGTYLGVLGLSDSETGIPLTYAPLTVQVGLPELEVVGGGNLVLGKPSLVTIEILDKTTLKPVERETKVIINGKEYYAVNGELRFIYTPLSLEDVTFNVKVISDRYKDFEGSFKLEVSEPLKKPATKTEVNIVDQETGANATILEKEIEPAKVTLVVNGTEDTTATVMIILPPKAIIKSVTAEPADHLVGWWEENGKKATYLFVKVKFASPVKISVEYSTPREGISLTLLNFLGYRWYNMYHEKFNETYQKALELGVDNETLQKALELNREAEQYYNEALELTGGNILLNLSDPRLIRPLRLAYLDEMKAVKLLLKAIEELEAQG